MKPFGKWLGSDRKPDENAPSEQVIQAMLNNAWISLQSGNPERALETYHQILQLQPNPTAQYNLGSLYAQGLGVGRDYVQAAYWFHQAEKNGHQNAGKLCLKCILDHLQQKQSEDTAARLYQDMLSLAGHIYPEENPAATANSLLFSAGSYNVQKENYAAAAKLLRAAAEFGQDGRCQNLLGVLYNAGAGVEKNDWAALYWFDCAADQGVEAARTDRDGIWNAYRTNLSKETFIQQVELLAENCRTGTEDFPKDPAKANYWKQRIGK